MLLRLTLPPFDSPIAWAAAGTALAGLLARLHARRESITTWSLVGIGIASTWASTLPMALAPWGLGLSVGAVATVSASMAAVMALAGWADLRVPRFGWLGFPVAIGLGCRAMDALALGPLSLIAGPAFAAPETFAVVRWLGAGSVETLAALGVACLGRLLGQPGHRGAHVGLTCALLAFVVPAWLQTEPTSHATASLHVVQPATSMERFRAARSSLAVRSQLERDVDGLLRSAARRGPGLIVTPEGLTGLPDRRLRRRITALRDALAAVPEGELLLGSYDLAPSGQKFATVARFVDGSFAEQARKAHPVPGPEGELSAGGASVLETGQGRVGISICYDAIFSGHIRSLTAAGAQWLLSSSDDASFGDSFLADWHAAFASLRALEVGLPHLFLANGQPARSFDGNARPLWKQDGRVRPGVASIQLPYPRQAPGPWLPWWVGDALLASACLALAYAAGARSPGAARPTPWRGAWVLPLAALVSYGAEVPWVSLERGARMDSVVAQWQRRIGAPTSTTRGVGAAFRQSEQQSCGAAAMAYLLTQLGDLVFEDELTRLVPPARDGGYSLAELAEMARARGFAARGVRMDWESTPRRGETPALAHMRAGHFVVWLGREDDSAWVFDPSDGTTRRLPRDAYPELFSGKLLEVSTTDLDAGG